LDKKYYDRSAPFRFVLRVTQMTLRKPWRISYWTFVAALVGGVLVLYVTGFCFSALRYLRDEELIKAAVAFRAPEIAEFSSTNSREPITAYINSHPECCTIEREFPVDAGILSRLSGFNFTWVRVVHRLTLEQIRIAPDEGDYYEANIAIDPCGRAVKIVGMRTKRAPGS
jgi:hypothetical protein